MQQIQWYPGHMHKANREIKEILPIVDVLVEVLDARIPFSSQNPLLASMRGDKPCIKVLVKHDLADEEKTRQWQAWMEREKGVKTLALSMYSPDDYLQIASLCRKLAPEKDASEKDVLAMIMGIPNVGKSTLINKLAGRPIAKTGNEPAVTKRQQRIRIADGIMLFDTPGVLWPNLENRHGGYRLAVTGAIRDTALSHDDIACWAAGYLRQYYPERLAERFQVDLSVDDEVTLLEAIGRRRGCLSGGGHIDFDKAAKILLNDIRGGALGKITFEVPDDVEREAAEVLEMRELKARQKAEKKLARRKGWRDGGKGENADA